MAKYRFTVVVERDEDGIYISSCPAIKGCYSQGETYEETLKNIGDAIRLHIEDRKEGAEDIEDPRDVILSSVEVSVSR